MTTTTPTTTATPTGPAPARMPHPAAVLPDAMAALLALGRAVEAGPLPHRTHELVQLRASQINGCGLCVDLHARELRAAGAPEELVWAVAAWRGRICPDTPRPSRPADAGLSRAGAPRTMAG